MPEVCSDGASVPWWEKIEKAVQDTLDWPDLSTAGWLSRPATGPAVPAGPNGCPNNRSARPAARPPALWCPKMKKTPENGKTPHNDTNISQNVKIWCPKMVPENE